MPFTTNDMVFSPEGSLCHPGWPRVLITLPRALFEAVADGVMVGVGLGEGFTVVTDSTVGAAACGAVCAAQPVEKMAIAVMDVKMAFKGPPIVNE